MYWLVTTAPPVASALMIWIIRVLKLSTRLTPDTAASPTEDTIRVSARPMVTLSACSAISGSSSATSACRGNRGVDVNLDDFMLSSVANDKKARMLLSYSGCCRNASDVYNNSLLRQIPCWARQGSRSKQRSQRALPGQHSTCRCSCTLAARLAGVGGVPGSTLSVHTVFHRRAKGGAVVPCRPLVRLGKGSVHSCQLLRVHGQLQTGQVDIKIREIVRIIAFDVIPQPGVLPVVARVSMVMLVPGAMESPPTARSASVLLVTARNT